MKRLSATEMDLCVWVRRPIEGRGEFEVFFDYFGVSARPCTPVCLFLCMWESRGVRAVFLFPSSTFCRMARERPSFLLRNQTTWRFKQTQSHTAKYLWAISWNAACVFFFSVFKGEPPSRILPARKHTHGTRTLLPSAGREGRESRTKRMCVCY